MKLRGRLGGHRKGGEERGVGETNTPAILAYIMPRDMAGGLRSAGRSRRMGSSQERWFKEFYALCVLRGLRPLERSRSFRQ